MTAGWQPRPPLNIARLGAAGATAGGRVIVAGGYPSASFSDVLRSAERLEPDGSWTEGQSVKVGTESRPDPTPMPTARGNAAAASLRGRIYVIGGYSATGSLDVVESYDPQRPTDDWTTVAPLPVKVGGLGAAAVGDRIYAGGGAGDGDPIRRVWAYDPDPASGQWHKIAKLNFRRTLFKMAALDGKLYAIGGVDVVNGDPVPLDSVERYDPEQPKSGWEVIRPTLKPRAGNAGVLSAFGRIFVVGGVPNETRSSSTTEMYDPADGHWHLLAPLLTPARGTLVTVRQGKEMLAIAGGVFSVERRRPVAVAQVDALRIDQPDALLAPARTRLPG